MTKKKTTKNVITDLNDLRQTGKAQGGKVTSVKRPKGQQKVVSGKIEADTINIQLTLKTGIQKVTLTKGGKLVTSISQHVTVAPNKKIVPIETLKKGQLFVRVGQEEIWEAMGWDREIGMYIAFKVNDDKSTTTWVKKGTNVITGF